MRDRNKPRLLSDNGPCFLSQELNKYPGKKGITYIPREHIINRKQRVKLNGIINL
ncbi:hypothetical protein ACFL40_00930 [candidate division KSB1 bacterium]